MHRDLEDVQIWADTDQETDELLDTINQKSNKNESSLYNPGSLFRRKQFYDLMY